MSVTPMRIEVCALTHRGRVRERNEDCIAINAWVNQGSCDRADHLLIDGDGPHVILVADGMGGHQAGNVASRHVAEQLFAEVATTALSADGITAALRQVNQRLYSRMDETPTTRGMGSTVVGICMHGERAWMFNIGDSPGFRHRGGFLRKFSTDDVAAVPTFGDAAPTTKLAITASIGGTRSFAEVSPHITEIGFDESTCYLLASDGLTDLVPVDTIEALLNQPPAAALQALYQAAMAAGGHDNFSALIIRRTTAGSLT